MLSIFKNLFHFCFKSFLYACFFPSLCLFFTSILYLLMGQFVGLLRMVRRDSIQVKKKKNKKTGECLKAAAYNLLPTIFQILSALARVPLCNRNTFKRYIRTYLKQAAIHVKMIVLSFL